MNFAPPFHARPNSSPVTLPDGRTGRWYRVGREQPQAMWPGWPAWFYDPRGRGDCGRMRPMCPRLDQVEGRWGRVDEGAKE